MFIFYWIIIISGVNRCGENSYGKSYRKILKFAWVQVELLEHKRECKVACALNVLKEPSLICKFPPKESAYILHNPFLIKMAAKDVQKITLINARGHFLYRFGATGEKQYGGLQPSLLVRPELSLQEKI